MSKQKLATSSFDKEFARFAKGVRFNPLVVVTVTITNETPCHWGAVIYAVGLKFFFRDNTDYQMTQAVSLGCNQSQSFTSGDANKDKCCHTVYCLLTLRMDGKDVTVTGTYSVNEGECAQNVQITLKPKQTYLLKNKTDIPFDLSFS